MEKLTLDYYQKERFELIGEINEDYIEGYFVWNETMKRKRKMIDELIDDEDEFWFLDKDGYRLEDHELFERSPWSLVIDNRIEKIVERFFDYRTGEARFAIRPWLRIGDELNSRKGGEVKVKRIVANIHSHDIELAKSFYQDVLGLELMMNHGWIATYGSKAEMSIQISFASEGGSETATPDLSIEVDDIDEVYKRMKDAGFKIEYGPINEPWGVRRFYVRDPYNKLINILAHNKN